MKRIRQRDLLWGLLVFWIVWCDNIIGVIMWLCTLLVIWIVKLIVKEFRKSKIVNFPGIDGEDKQ